MAGFAAFWSGAETLPPRSTDLWNKRCTASGTPNCRDGIFLIMGIHDKQSARFGETKRIFHCGRDTYPCLPCYCITAVQGVLGFDKARLRSTLTAVFFSDYGATVEENLMREELFLPVLQSSPVWL